jgi:hypothetical protein
MSGRNRLPSGEPRRASQKRARPAAPKPIQVAEIPWRAGDKVRRRGRARTYRRDIGDGEHVEIVIAERVYRVCQAELRQG